EEESAALRLGAVDFISKPVNASVVRARVRSQLMLRQTLREVQDLNQNLEARVAQRTAELQQALEHLQRSQEELAHSAANATLSTLIAGVSHELNTPLGNSKMVAGTMAEHARDVVRAMQAGLLKRSALDHFMEQTTEGLALLLRNLERSVELLADFRQVAADQASEQRRTFNLAEAINEILHTLSPSLKRHPHKVVVDIPQEITMDSLPGPLGQVVINLVNNAYLHAFEGRTNGVLTIEARQHGDQIQMAFIDNGVGMDPDHLAKLFVPFFSTKIGKGGTGLGMAIVRNLVNKTLGGRVAVSSTLGEGARFDMTLPRVLARGAAN
ncbi:MAG: hybrid sensor histidine kinase/response regulator, partial [Rhodoferax sp.]